MKRRHLGVLGQSVVSPHPLGKLSPGRPARPTSSVEGGAWAASEPGDTWVQAGVGIEQKPQS